MLLTFLVRRRVALGLTMMAACGLPFDPAAAEEQTSSWSWLAHGRTRFESAADSLYGTGRDGEDALYQRLHVGAEYRSDVFETRVTLNLHGQSGLDNPGPKDRGPADLQDAYIGFHLGDGLFNARIGRQAIRFGKKRFVDTSNSSNQRAAFDGIDLNLRSDNRELRAFVVQPLLHQADEAFDDKADDRIRLAVVQGSWDNRSEGGSLWEIYGLRYRRDRGSFDDVRRSLGIRQVGTHWGWEIDAELQIQRGDVGGTDVSAYALGAFASQPYEWSIWDKSKWLVQLDLASGEDPNSDDIELFNPILPSRSTFSQAGFTGYANLRHLKLGTEVNKGAWKSSASIGLMQRMRTDDAVYAHSASALPGSDSASSARNSGTYLQFKIERALGENAKIYSEWVHLDAQRGITAAGGSDQDYFALSLEWDFQN